MRNWHPAQWFFKLLVLLGVVALIIVQMTTPDLGWDGRAVLGFCTLGWLAILFFVELDV